MSHALLCFHVILGLPPKKMEGHLHEIAVEEGSGFVLPGHAMSGTPTSSHYANPRTRD
jgi:hypothetical protein